MRAVFIGIIFLLSVAANLAIGQDSLNVRQVGLLRDYNDSAYGIALVDSIAYVAYKEGGLRILHVGSNSQIREIGWLSTPGCAWDIEVLGSHAFIADADYGLRIIDISDPAMPIEVGSAEADYARRVTVSGDYVFVSDYYSGMRIIDKSNPFVPSEVGFFATTENIKDVSIQGNYALAAFFRPEILGDGTLRVIDFSNPENPVEVGSLELPGRPEAIVSTEQCAYISLEHEGIYTVDVSTPSEPILVGSSPVTASGMIIRDDLIFAACGEGLRVLDIQNPYYPVYFATYSTVNSVDIAVDSNCAYLANGSRGVRQIDITDLSSLSELAHWDPQGIALRSAVHGNTAFIAEGNRGLRIVDFSDPSSPIEVTTLITSQAYFDAKILNDLAFVTSEDATGIYIFDISRPYDPELEEFFELPYFRYIDIAENYVYSQALHGDFYIIDVSNPAMPVEVGSADIPDYTSSYDLAVSGEVAGIINYDLDDFSLLLVDISTPTAPVLVNSVPLEGSARGIAIDDNSVFVTEGFTGPNSVLRVFDISNASNPAEVGMIEYAGDAEDLVIVNNYAFVACGEGGIRIFDVFNREQMIEVGYYHTPGDARHICINDDLAYVAQGSYFGVYDVSSILEADDFGIGLIPESIALYPSYPNPFNPMATIRFDLPVAGDVKLTVYNTVGQAVETLVDGTMNPGSHVATFDGTRFSSGSYFYRLQAGDFSETRRMMLVK